MSILCWQFLEDTHQFMKKADKILDTKMVKTIKKTLVNELFAEAEEILNELDARKPETKSRPALKSKKLN